MATMSSAPLHASTYGYQHEQHQDEYEHEGEGHEEQVDGSYADQSEFQEPTVDAWREML